MGKCITLNITYSDVSMEDEENDLLKKLKKFYREERLNKTHHLKRVQTIHDGKKPSLEQEKTVKGNVVTKCG